MSNMTSTASRPYRQAAEEKFAALKRAYAGNDKQPKDQQVAFWRLGNSFDTMIDYLEVIDASAADEIAKIADTQLRASLKHISCGWDGAWFDDFGWWSVAAQRALQKPFFAPAGEILRGILHECWSRFTANAPYVWERRQPGSFEAYGPAVAGGVWNAYWKGTANRFPGPKNGDPSVGTLVGIQNAVTNAIYLMIAHRLGHNDPAARRAAESELLFFLTWFDKKDFSLWRSLDQHAGLVRERVGAFANASPAPGFQEDWAWTGDQGLMLGNLSDAMLHLEPGFRGPLLARARALLAGVQQRLVSTQGVLESYTQEGYVPDGDLTDYATGPGVFWRNALYVHKTNADLRSSLASPEYRRVLLASANAAADAPTGTAIDSLTNETAVLVAATAMLI